jgi:pimeloyl-ACP methyl ester carboxylesterase
MQTRSRGHDIHYESRGDGPGLLLIHGVLQSSQRWIDCGYPEEFADSFHVVMPDLLGHGESDKPDEADEYTVDGHLADLLAVLDAEGLRRVHVWGYSAGTGVAAALAARHPDRVASLVLGGIPPNLPDDGRRAVAEAWAEPLRSADWDLFWQRFLPMLEETRKLLERENDPIAVAAFIDGWVDTVPPFSRLDVPTLCYEGTSEVFFDLAAETAREMGAELVTVDGLAHDEAFLQLDAVAPTVHDFLSRSAADDRLGTHS